MTKSQFNKAKKYLHNKIKHYDFELSENGKIYRSDVRGSDSEFVELGVDTLFELVAELNKKNEELETLKNALKKIEFDYIDRQENGWLIQGFAPDILAKHIDALQNKDN